MAWSGDHAITWSTLWHGLPTMPSARPKVSPSSWRPSVKPVSRSGDRDTTMQAETATQHSSFLCHRIPTSEAAEAFPSLSDFHPWPIDQELHLLRLTFRQSIRVRPLPPSLEVCRRR